jgi:hypothetical protein
MTGIEKVHYNAAAGVCGLYVGATRCGLANRMYFQSRQIRRVTCRRCLRLERRRQYRYRIRVSR